MENPADALKIYERIEMKKGRGKEKGSEFERVIAKELSKWVGVEGCVWRSKDSGIDKKNQPGDLVAVKQEAMWLFETFMFELKFWKGFPIHWIFFGLKSFWDYWRKSKRESIEADRRLIFVIKSNEIPAFVIVEEDVWLRFFKDLLRCEWVCKIKVRKKNYEGDEVLYLFSFEDLLKSDVEAFKQNVKEK